MTVINLYAGPSAGKSTTSAELFSAMKKAGYRVEYCTEFAKDLVYGKDQIKLQDQLYVFAKQHHRLHKLRDQLDYVIMDSPLLLSCIYFSEDSIYNFEHFSTLVKSVYYSYNNIDIFLERGDTEFQSYGRNHNLEESIELDNQIKHLLKSIDAPVHYVLNDENTITHIKSILGQPEFILI